MNKRIRENSEVYSIPKDRAVVIVANIEKYIDAEDTKMTDKIQKIIGKDDQYNDLSVSQWNKLEKLFKIKKPMEAKPAKMPSKIKLTKEQKDLVKEYAANLISKRKLNESDVPTIDEFNLSDNFESLHDEMVSCLVAMDDIAGNTTNKYYRAVEDLVGRIEKIEKAFNAQIKMFKDEYGDNTAHH